MLESLKDNIDQLMNNMPCFQHNYSRKVPNDDVNNFK